MVGLRNRGTLAWVLAGAAIALLSVLAIQLATPNEAGAATKLISSTTSLNQANETPRKTVLCPRGNPAFKFPYGGSMYSMATYGPDGEGVYPHSYERLGVQGGYHVTPVLFDPSPPSMTRDLVLQVVCGPEPGKLNPPHLTSQVDPGQSKTHNVQCTGKRKLIGGGFQRTDFTGRGGNYATESHAIGPDAWQVSGTAFGNFGGELTGIAYCRKKGGLSEVSATTMVNPGSFGQTTTPSCPKGKSLVFAGFDTEPLGSIFYAGGPINANQSTTGGGYNRSLAPATLTIFGYCLRAKPNL